jgi:hypothetical protein
MSDLLNYAQTPQIPQLGLKINPFEALNCGKPSTFKDINLLGAGINSSSNTLVYNSPYYQDAGLGLINNTTPIQLTNADWFTIDSINNFTPLYPPSPNYLINSNGEITTTNPMALGNCVVYCEIYVNTGNNIAIPNVVLGISVNFDDPEIYNSSLPVTVRPMGSTPSYIRILTRLDALAADSVICMAIQVQGGVGFNNLVISAAKIIVQCAPSTPVA